MSVVGSVSSIVWHDAGFVGLDVSSEAAFVGHVVHSAASAIDVVKTVGAMNVAPAVAFLMSGVGGSPWVLDVVAKSVVAVVVLLSERRRVTTVAVTSQRH